MGDGSDNEDDDPDFPPSHGHQQQQFYMETQDRMLDSISGTVSTLKAQAGLMGREVLDQVGMLEDLEAGVDRSQSRLDRAQKRMNDFIRANKSEPRPGAGAWHRVSAGPDDLSLPSALRLKVIMDHLSAHHRPLVSTPGDYLDLTSCDTAS